MKTHQYQTTKYWYFDNHKEDLIVILPGAGHDQGSHQPLINKLLKLANILIIEKGYFGLTSIQEDRDLKLYSSSNFCQNLKLLLTRYKYSKLYILGSSVGCIHAIKFILGNPDINCKVLLASPPILTFGKSRIVLFFINLALMISPIYSLSLFIKIINLFPGLRGVSKIMKKTVKKIGYRPYLLCLKEIAQFSSNNFKLIDKISKRSIVIVFSKSDPTYNFCHIWIKKMTGKRGIINGHHSLFTEVPDVIYRIVATKLID